MEQKIFRRMKFTRYVEKQKVFEKIAMELTGEAKIPSVGRRRKILIGMGNWGGARNSPIRKQKRGPVIALQRYLRYWCIVLSINERCK